MTPHQEYVIRACAERKGMSYELFIAHLVQIAVSQVQPTKTKS